MELPPTWTPALGDELGKPYFAELRAFVAQARAAGPVFPPEAEVFAALAHTPFDEVKVVLLGQDPYHDDGQAHGLCFSVRPPTPPPPSLKNIFKELESDLGHGAPASGDLTAWARQGVLLLNTVLTVTAHEAASHAGRGWETFTDAVIERLNRRARPLVFCLWGNHAKKKAKLVDRARHRLIEGAHPSPLSAKKFLGSRPFSAVNAALAELGHAPIDWRL
jgi:uracil-DNA glycosylase